MLHFLHRVKASLYTSIITSYFVSLRSNIVGVGTLATSYYVLPQQHLVAISTNNAIRFVDICGEDRNFKEIIRHIGEKSKKYLGVIGA